MELHGYRLVLMIFTVYGLNSCVKCQTYDNFTNLQNDLLTSYNACARPVLNQSDILNVNISLILFNTQSVDTIRGTFELGVQVVETWKDERMTWDPADYGGLNQVTFDVTKVFYPKICMSNSIVVKPLTQDFIVVKYSHDGSAYHDAGDIVALKCVFHVTYWPFDKQICYISLFLHGYTNDEASLSANNPSLISSYFTQGGEWWVDLDAFETKVDTSFYMSQLHYKFKMNRRSTYYILTFILPIASLGYLAGMVFFLPSDAGTRVNYNMTIMLSLAVFLGVVSDDIPRGSESVPIFCVFLVFSISVCVLLTVIVIINARIFVRRGDIPVSEFYKKLVKITKRGNKVDIQRTKEERNEKSKTVYDIKDNEELTTKYAKDEEIEQTRINNDTDMSWEDVSLAIDKLVIVLLILFGYIPGSILIICCSNLPDQCSAVSR